MWKEYVYKRGKKYIGIRFWSKTRHIKERIFRQDKGIQSEILNTTRFDENSDLSTTYLGKADRSKNSKIRAEQSFPISGQGYTLGKLLDRTECQILLDIGASKSVMCYNGLLIATVVDNSDSPSIVGAVTTKVLAVAVFLYYSLSLALWSILCLMPLA